MKNKKIILWKTLIKKGPDGPNFIKISIKYKYVNNYNMKISLNPFGQ